MATPCKTLNLGEYIISQATTLRGTNMTPLEGTISHTVHALIPCRRLLWIMEEDWNNCQGCCN